jgi:hypothetical protein
MRKLNKFTDETEVFCDCCGNNTGLQYNICSICLRDYCKNCTKYYSQRVLSNGNANEHCCSICYSTGKEIIDKMNTLKDEFDIKLSKLKTEWRDKSKPL